MAFRFMPARSKVFGITVYPRRVPVKPAVFDSEQISMAHVLAPGISKMLCGSSGSSINASYAASNRITAPVAFANSTHLVSASRPNTAPVGLFGEQMYSRSAFVFSSGSGRKPLSMPDARCTTFRPSITFASTYAGYAGSITSELLLWSNRARISPSSSLAPLETNTSSASS